MRRRTASDARARPGADDAPFEGLTPEALRFFRRLARHNTRDWFEAHRAAYERWVRDPLRRLVEEVDVRLAGLAPEIVGDPKRSLFRIHRDVRFSADKRPYKTNAGIRFYHRDAGINSEAGQEGAAAGFYFQFGAEAPFSAAGLWMPGRAALGRIRERLVDDQAGFEALLRAPAFRRRFGALDEEAMLKRLPRGFGPGHPAERWLRYQSFTVTRELTEAELLSPKLPALLAKDFAVARGLVRWLNGAVGYREAARR